ncbi:hypothetical protein R6U77_12745 [Lysinibacillus louembei]|uniref:Uncharacterized protein n=1 Tax=Lysinibacillus louembei TaxID=1470088 RepID=A0ABZ0RUV2_9BACI|nr:hypothetical protein [Lysinibacillus louembei]WPK10748.1 hypothetical protein R6U77_12745 [Lysinibacillus louembei]
MKSISIRIEGEYWDYLIKYNALFLWTFEGTLEIYDWEYLLNDLSYKMKDNNIYKFFRGNINSILLNVHNKDMKESSKINLRKSEIQKYKVREFWISTNDLIISLDSYNDDLLLNTDEGLLLCNLKEILVDSNNIHTNTLTKEKYYEKIFDMPFFDISIGNYGNVALAGGEEGVFEFVMPQKKYNETNEVKHIIKKQSNKVDWLKNSIYNTSPIEESFILNKPIERGVWNYNDYKIYEDSQIFRKNDENVYHSNISWANNNKIYRVVDSRQLQEVTVQNFGNGELAFRSRYINFMEWKGDILAGAGTSFGTVVECENALVVIFKNKDFINIPGEIVRWKYYKSNERYSNLLGVIFDKSIVLQAFEPNNYFKIRSINKSYFE